MKNLTAVCIAAMLCFAACKKDIESSVISVQQTDQLRSNDSAHIRVNVKDFGAKGDGMTDDWLAFQAAEDFVFSKGGGTVYVPSGVYIVSEPFFHRSFVTLRGDGDGSIIRNNKGKKGSGDGQFCIHIGNFSPSNYSQCVHYDVNDITAGSNIITFKNISDAASFSAGEAVLVDTDDGFMSDDNKFKPYEAFINRIVLVDSVNGIITLEDPVSTDVHHAKIGSTIKFIPGAHNDTNKVYICKNPVIKNIRFETSGDWTMRYGVYKGLFDNISVKTTDVIAGNGISHCIFRNIRAEYSQKIVEMAMYSHDSYINGLDAVWWDGHNDIVMKPLIKMGENIRDCSFTGMNIKSGSERKIGMIIRYEHAFNNRIFKNHFECDYIIGSVVELTTSDSLSVITGNETYDNTFIVNKTSGYIKLDNEACGSVLAYNSVTGNSFNGQVKKPVYIKNAENNLVENNTYNY